MKTPILIAAFATLMASAPVFAQEQPGGDGPPPMMRGGGGPGMDQPMKRADVEARTKQRFQFMDKNGDGVLSGDEIPQRMAQFMDPTGSGKVTLDQMLATAMKRFDAADANHDGIVTPEERMAARGQ